MPRPRGVLSARNLRKSYGDARVLDRASLTVSPGNRIGVVGPNGIGKTTLLRLLAGLEQPDSGTVSRDPPDLSVSYLPQEKHEDRRSGGEAARAKLEAIIAAEAGVLLLDEPTNDLDDAALELLERFVDRHWGGLVVVSHDRAFLERVNRIVELEPETRTLREYAGGWSEFAAERQRLRERHERAYGRYSRERERVEAQARRMRQWEERGFGQGRKKKKGKDLRKRYEHSRDRLEQVEKPWRPWRLELELAPARRAGDEIVRLESAIVRRRDFQLGPLDFELAHGERVAIVGRNGAGKTTLLRALLGELPLAEGQRWVGPGVSLGELPQGPGPFASGRPLVEEFLQQVRVGEGEARALLAKFELGADDIFRAGRSLSPGERSRAVLALLAVRGVNTLILDEPTNNLDLEAIEQLEAALAMFAGTIVLVTHDRYFLRAFEATRTLELGLN